MTLADLPSVVRIQAECYPPQLNEDEGVIRDRFLGSPNTAWICEVDGEVLAYLVGYPSRIGKVTSLGGAFDVPADADSLYLHDLAVSSRARGRGVGEALVAHAHDVARSMGLGHSALVAVQNSSAFWASRGYCRAVAVDRMQREALAAYPGGGDYMTSCIPKTG